MPDHVRFDLAIVGGGVLGLFHALAATRSNLKTILFERSPRADGASVRNFGMVIPSGMTPGDWLNRANRSREIYLDLAKQIPIPLQFGGSQYVAQTDPELHCLHQFAERATEFGYRCRLLDSQQSRDLNPALRVNSIRGSLHFPDDLRFDPRELPKYLVPYLIERMHLQYRPHETVEAVELRANSVLLRSNQGSVIEADQVIVCSGADLRTLFPEAFRDLIYCKLQMMRTRPQPTLRLASSIASGLSIRRYQSFSIASRWNELKQLTDKQELIQRGIHLLFAQDADARVVIGDSHEYASTPMDEAIDRTTQELILQEAKSILNLQTWEIEDEWVGIYTQHPTQDHLRLTIENRIHLLNGLGGKGMTTGPALAEETVNRLG